MVLWQWPNRELWVTLAAATVAKLSDGWLHAAASAVFFLAGAIWAYLELTHGVNWFRRGLGAVFLLYFFVQLLRHLHG